jgi:uncharacterized protein
MAIGLLTLHVQFPGCKSLKEKRSRLKPLIARLHREFNISVAELDHLDVWDDAVLGCALISNNPQYNQRSLQSITLWLDKNWPDVILVEDHIEIIV